MVSVRLRDCPFCDERIQLQTRLQGGYYCKVCNSDIPKSKFDNRERRKKIIRHQIRSKKARKETNRGHPYR